MSCGVGFSLQASEIIFHMINQARSNFRSAANKHDEYYLYTYIFL